MFHRTSRSRRRLFCEVDIAQRRAGRGFKLEKFLEDIQRRSLKELNDCVDLYLELQDPAVHLGNEELLAWASVRWNSMLDEIDARRHCDLVAAS